jgi:hypothetical protein
MSKQLSLSTPAEILRWNNVRAALNCMLTKVLYLIWNICWIKILKSMVVNSNLTLLNVFLWKKNTCQPKDSNHQPSVPQEGILPTEPHWMSLIINYSFYPNRFGWLSRVSVGFKFCRFKFKSWWHWKFVAYHFVISCCWVVSIGFWDHVLEYEVILYVHLYSKISISYLYWGIIKWTCYSYR